MAHTRYAETVPAIREAARRVLAEAGPGGLTVRAVASEAGVSPQSLYNRFGCRAALLDDVATAGYRRLGDRLIGRVGPPLESPLGSVGDPLAVVTEAFRRYRAFALAEPEFHRFLFDEPIEGFVPSERTLRARRETLDIFVAVTRRAIDAGLLSPGDRPGWPDGSGPRPTGRCAWSSPGANSPPVAPVLRSSAAIPRALVSRPPWPP